MADTVDQHCRDRVTKLEGEVLDLKTNYAPMLQMEKRFNEQNASIQRIESAITRTNDTMSGMARQFELTNAETARQLKVVFEMDSKRMEQIGRHQQELQDEKVAAIRAENAEKIALIQAQKEKVEQENLRLAEQGKLINKMKNWKFVVGFLTALIVLGGLSVKGLIWVIEYGVKHAR